MNISVPKSIPRVLAKIAAVALMLLPVELVLSVVNGYAVDFYGADIADTDLPSSFMKVGLIGLRPVVSTVAEGSPAADGGFQRGDVILSVDGTGVKKTNDLTLFSSDSVSVVIFRSNENITLNIKKRVTGKADPRPVPAEKPAAVPLTQAVAPAAAVPSLPAENNAPKDDRPKPPAEASAGTVPEQAPPSTDTSREAPGAGNRDTALAEVPKQVEQVKADQDTADPAAKSDLMERRISPVQDHVIFPNDRGDVTFSHSVHLNSLKKVQCLSCHKTDHPTPEKIQARLSNHRAAHGFCKGCHQKVEKGPTTECHVCHITKPK